VVTRRNGRLGSVAVLGVALLVVGTGAPADAGRHPQGADPPYGDSITGSGEYVLEVDGVGSFQTTYAFDAHSGPSGEDPSGTVDLGFGLGPVTCMTVSSVDAPPHTRARINVTSSGFGLVTLEVSTAAEGFPPQVFLRYGSTRDPGDCSPLAFVEINARGALPDDGVTIVDVPPLPTTLRECLNGGWRAYGARFSSLGECIRHVVRA
jgi:hypothetical protein